MSLHPVRSVKVRADVATDPDDLFAYVANTLNDPEWCPNVDSVEQVSGDGVEVGARFRFRQHLDRGKRGRIDFDADVEVVDVGKRSITWHVSDRFQERTIELSVGAGSSGSRITQTTAAAFRRKPGVLRVAYPLLAKRTLRQQFAELQRRYE